MSIKIETKLYNLGTEVGVHLETHRGQKFALRFATLEEAEQFQEEFFNKLGTVIEIARESIEANKADRNFRL